MDENELDEFDCWNNINTREFARVVINPKYQYLRYSKYLISYCLSEMKNRKYENIHISVANKNIPALKLYESLKFTKIGNASMWGNDYYLYEKKI